MDLNSASLTMFNLIQICPHLFLSYLPKKKLIPFLKVALRCIADFDHLTEDLAHVIPSFVIQRIHLLEILVLVNSSLNCLWQASQKCLDSSSSFLIKIGHPDERYSSLSLIWIAVSNFITKDVFLYVQY